MSDGDRPSCSARDCTNPVVGSFAWRGQRYYYCEDHNFSGPHGDLAPQVEVPAASSLTVQQLSQAFEHLPAIELPGHAERIGRRVYESVIGPDNTCMFLVWDGSSFGFQNLILLSDRVARPLKMDGLPYEPYRVESFDESELARLEGIAIDPRSLYDEVKLQTRGSQSKPKTGYSARPRSLKPISNTSLPQHTTRSVLARKVVARMPGLNFSDASATGPCSQRTYGHLTLTGSWGLMARATAALLSTRRMNAKENPIS